MGASPEIEPRPPAVVLVRPREAGNVGAACRAMANMGLSELHLVEPAAHVGSEPGSEARRFAVHAHHVLDGARRHPSLADALAPFRRVVGTTSARDRTLSVPVVTPRRLAETLRDEPPLPTALVFGSEVGGLTNDELALCDVHVTIPADPVQPTLNLAQAVLVVAYELYQSPWWPLSGDREGGEPLADPRVEPPAAVEVVEGLFGHLQTVFEEVGFARDTTIDGVLRDLRQLAARARPTEREVTVLRGVLRRIGNALERARRGLDRADGAEPEAAEPADNIPRP